MGFFEGEDTYLKDEVIAIGEDGLGVDVPAAPRPGGDLPPGLMDEVKAAVASIEAEMGKDNPDQARISAWQDEMRASLPVFESMLAGREYLIGDFSAADVMLGHAIFMANRLGAVTDEMQNLKGYVKRIEARPAFQTAINL